MHRRQWKRLVPTQRGHTAEPSQRGHTEPGEPHRRQNEDGRRRGARQATQRVGGISSPSPSTSVRGAPWGASEGQPVGGRGRSVRPPKPRRGLNQAGSTLIIVGRQAAGDNPTGAGDKVKGACVLLHSAAECVRFVSCRGRVERR